LPARSRARIKIPPATLLRNYGNGSVVLNLAALSCCSADHGKAVVTAKTDLCSKPYCRKSSRMTAAICSRRHVPSKPSASSGLL